MDDPFYLQNRGPSEGTTYAPGCTYEYLQYPGHTMCSYKDDPTATQMIDAIVSFGIVSLKRLTIMFSLSVTFTMKIIMKHVQIRP